MAISNWATSPTTSTEGEQRTKVMDDEVREPSPSMKTRSPKETSTYRSVAELAVDIGLSERSTRAALRRGEIPHIRIGRRFILPRAAIADWLRTAGRRMPNGQG